MSAGGRESADDVPPAAAEPSGSRELRERAEIEAQLRRLGRYRTLLSVRRSGDAQAHPSAVLAVQNARVLIDALPEELSVAGAPLQLRTRFDGAELIFQTRTLGRAVHDGAPALAIALPESIRLLERRAVRRLPLPPQASLPPSTARLDDAEFHFEVTDVSVLGAGGIAREPPVLMVGDALELQVQLPGTSLPVRAEVRVRHGQGRSVHLGLRFTDLRPHQLDRLAAALLRLERQAIRAAKDAGR